jgi:hypothetical protein
MRFDVGVDSQRQGLFIDHAKTPGVFVGGSTNAGKSNLARVAMIRAFESCQGHLRCLVIDPKGGRDYTDLIETCRAEIFDPSDGEQFHKVLEILEGEAAQADAFIRGKTSQATPLMIVVDEAYMCMKPSTAKNSADKARQQRLVDVLDVATRRFRLIPWGVWILSQGGEKSELDLAKKNIGVWLCGRLEDGVSAYYFGSDIATRPDLREGRFLYRSPDRDASVTLIRVAHDGEKRRRGFQGLGWLWRWVRVVWSPGGR